MKDVKQKDMLCRHFGSQDWYVQPEVKVFHRGGLLEHKKPITDIDVLALRPGANLNWELVLGDCRTLKGQSPVNRAIWLRGLMEYFSASSGVILLQKKQPIEQDHKLFAASLGIALLDESEFLTYDKALIYPSGSSNFPLSLENLYELSKITHRYPSLKSFGEYIYILSWNEPNRLELIRKVIGEGQNISREIDPKKTDHLSLVLEAAGLFAIGLAECVGIIFNQYLKPEKLGQLDDALKVIIWGGRSQYEFIAKLRSDFMEAKGIQPKSGGVLALPYWDKFLQLVRNMLEAPRTAFSVPQILRRAAIDVNQGNAFLSNTNSTDLLLIKLAMLTSEYLCRASKFPADTMDALLSLFAKKQSEIVHSPNKTTQPGHDHEMRTQQEKPKLD